MTPCAQSMNCNKYFWCPGALSFPGQATTALQSSLKPKHFLEPPNSSTDCLVLVKEPTKGYVPIAPYWFARVRLDLWDVEGVRWALLANACSPFFISSLLMALTTDRHCKCHGRYKSGRHQVAERLYRALLRAQPHHPDATYQVGVLGVSIDKPVEAIPLSNWRLKPTHR